MDNVNESPWLSGWKNIGKYLGKSAKTAQRYAREGMPVFRDPGGRPIARTDQIDQYLFDENRQMKEQGYWKGFGIEDAVEMIDEEDRQRKEFNKKLLDAQRPTRGRY